MKTQNKVGIFFQQTKKWFLHMDRVKRIWYLTPMRAAKVQVSLRIRAVSPEPPLLAHTNSESRGTFRQKARSLAPLNGWACAVKICHDGMLEDTKLLDGTHMCLEERWEVFIVLLKFVPSLHVYEQIFSRCYAEKEPCHSLRWPEICQYSVRNIYVEPLFQYIE